MKTTKILISAIFLILITTLALGQVAINQQGSSPDPTATLTVSADAVKAAEGFVTVTVNVDGSTYEIPKIELVQELESEVEYRAKVIKIDPTHWMSYNDISAIFFNSGNYLKARHYINLALNNLRLYSYRTPPN